MTTFANHVDDGPMSLPDLQILNSKRSELGPAQSATDEHGYHRNITDTTQIVTICFFQLKSSLAFWCGGQAASRL
jgi:hypothetical protein